MTTATIQTPVATTRLFLGNENPNVDNEKEEVYVGTFGVVDIYGVIGKNYDTATFDRKEGKWVKQEWTEKFTEAELDTYYPHIYAFSDSDTQWAMTDITFEAYVSGVQAKSNFVVKEVAFGATPEANLVNLGSPITISFEQAVRETALQYRDQLFVDLVAKAIKDIQDFVANLSEQLD